MTLEINHWFWLVVLVLGSILLILHLLLSSDDTRTERNFVRITARTPFEQEKAMKFIHWILADVAAQANKIKYQVVIFRDAAHLVELKQGNEQRYNHALAKWQTVAFTNEETIFKLDYQLRVVNNLTDKGDIIISACKARYHKLINKVLKDLKCEGIKEA